GEITGQIDENARSMEEQAEAVRRVEEAWQEYRNTLSPFQQLQADVIRAEGELKDALASGNTAEASAATDRLREARARLEAVNKTAAEAEKTYEERLVESVDAMRNHISSALQLEQSQQRVEQTQQRANEALKQ